MRTIAERPGVQLDPTFVKSGGAFVLVGGGGAAPESYLAGIFQRFIALAGGPDAPLAVLTCATRYPEHQASRTGSFFIEQGANEVLAPLIRNRAEADDPANAAQIRAARGIYLTGGDQSKYLNILNGTCCGEALLSAFREDAAVLGGTSAGAMVMGDVMIAASYDWVMQRRGVPLVRQGFGLLGTGVVVDTHFSQRRRIPRLMHVVRTLPGILGIGLDEDTALVIGADGQGEVMGAGCAYVFRSQNGRLQQQAVRAGARLDLAGRRGTRDGLASSSLSIR